MVGSELEGDEFRAFRILKKRARKEDIKKFILAVKNIKGYWKRTLIEAGRNIIDVCATENRETFEKLKKEDDVMSTALEEIMADDIQKKVTIAVQKEAVNTSEEIAKTMILDSEPVSIITKFTKVDKSRLSQIAKSVGMTLVSN